MKHNAMGANLRQSIRKSLGRYIAIMMIIALGGSIFVGLRMTKTDMVATGQSYMDAQNMFDLRLVNNYGWSKDQLESVRQLEGISDSEGVFYSDLIASYGDAQEEAVYRFYTLPQEINKLVLLGGRMPEAPNECLADAYQCDDSILGTQVVISQSNEEDTLETLTETVFTVVGYVSTPLYMDMNRGNTSVGSGSITSFLFVPEEAFDVDYYTEIHLTAPGDYAIYSDAYTDAMDALAQTLEPELEVLAQERYAQVLREAEEAYADGLTEYQDGLEEYYDGYHEAYGELRDAYWELIDGEAKLEDSEQSLIDGEAKLEDAQVSIQQSRVTLQNSRQTLADSKADAYAQISASSSQLFENYQEVSQNMQQVDSGLLEISSSLLSLNASISELESAASLIDSSIDQTLLLMELNRTQAKTNELALELALSQDPVDEAYVTEIRNTLTSLEEEYAEHQEQITAYNAEKAGYTQQLETTLYPQRDVLLAQQGELEANKAALEAAMAAIDQGYAELASSQASMEDQFAAAEAQIAAGESQLESYEAQLVKQEQQIQEGWKELEDGRQELEEGWESYRDGKEEAEAELSDARTELNDAKTELADARETLDTMTEASLHILDRTSNQGYSSLDSSSDIVAGVSQVFPVFFLLVAALVCITTMTRMVDEERTQIGTLKAMGYSNGAIVSKYLLYAGSSALLGCCLGTTIGSIVFPLILWEAYKIMLFIPGSMVLTFDWGLCLLVVFMYTLVELAVTWYCCYRALEEEPAELIRPKAPDPGKQLVFERFYLWKKLSFLNKVTIRNIFRYHQRLAMMLIGIGGCTALLLTGFGLQDSIVNIVSFQFEDITVYNMEVYFTEGQTEQEQQAFRRDLEGLASQILFFHQTSVDLSANDQTRELSLIAAGEEIQQFIDFHSGHQQLSMPGNGEVLLSVGVAEAMDIHVGDPVTLRNADLETLELTVSGIYENYVNNYAIVLPETIESQWGRTPDLQMAYVIAADGQDVHQVSAEISSLDDVMNVSVSQDVANLVSSMMDALDLVVVVIVICAALLAATVLYNLTNININERIREIATIKVLGFNAGETAMYIFKENLALTLMGTALGLGLGKLLLEFVMSQIKIDFVWFQARILPPSYLWAVLLTILTALIIDFIFYFRLEKINMAEALKSVE